MRITTRRGFVWLIAFCEWCIGIPPKVINFNTGRVFQDDADRKSSILIQFDLTTSKTTVEVSTHIDSPARLWEIGTPNLRVDGTWGGMVSLGQYGKRFTQECKLDEGLGSRALSQALMYSTRAVMSHLPFLRNEDKLSASSLSHLDTDLRDFSKRVKSAISQYLGAKDQEIYNLRELKEGQEIGDLHTVDQHIRALREQCNCPYCSDDPSSTETCLVHEFEYHVAHITAQILALSLFVLVEPVKLFFSASSLPHNVPQSGSLVVKAIAILFPNSKVGSKLEFVGYAQKGKDSP